MGSLFTGALYKESRVRNMLLGFITLTLLDGTPFGVESTPGVLTIITPSHNQCAHRGTAITVGAKGLCVREARDEIERLLRDANSHQ